MSKIHEGVWAAYDQGDLISQKLELVKRWIPTGVKNIIDIGCGNGIISNALAANYEVLGVDISETALAYVQTAKLQASATAIPLPENSYDLVFSSEMLEHLNDQDLYLACSEMMRLSKRYLLISVPHREQLAKSLLQCSSCGHVYHAYGHLHSFDKALLQELFPGCKQLKSTIFGPLERDWNPALLWIKHKLAHQYFHPNAAVLCPHCGGEGFVQTSNILSKACNALFPLLTKPRPYWLMLLLERA